MVLWIAISFLGIVGMIGMIGACFLASVYNQLVKLRSNCENAFAQIELQLKRRYDLIPNLVECVKSYMAHEKTTLESVIAARNQAAAGLKQAAQQPDNPDALQTWMGAESALRGALGRLTAVIESYPNLKADASVAELTEELTSTENRIAFARQAYNDWVTGFNTSRLAFPNCLFAGVFGFNRNRKHLEFADAEKLVDAPRVMLA
jgi:LemA protein